MTRLLYLVLLFALRRCGASPETWQHEESTRRA